MPASIHKNANKGKRFFLPVVIVLGFLVLLAILLVYFINGSKAPSIMETIGDVKGIVTTLGREEADFYLPLAKQEKEESGAAQLTEEELEQFAARVYAQFLIGEKLELCGPYSLDLIKTEMEKENSLRKSQKEQGKVVYGPLEYDLNSYFHYRLAQIKEQSVKALTEQRDPDLEKQSYDYWEKHQDQFTVIQEITYELTEDGSTEQKTLKQEDMSTLSKTDPQLLDILYQGEEGDEFSYPYGDGQRSGKILTIQRQTAGFQENKQEVIETYLAKIAYPELVTTIAESNPVECRQ